MILGDHRERRAIRRAADRVDAIEGKLADRIRRERPLVKRAAGERLKLSLRLSVDPHEPLRLAVKRFQLVIGNRPVADRDALIVHCPAPAARCGLALKRLQAANHPA